MDNELEKTFGDLIQQERKLASLRWTFWRGVFYGFGFFVGSVLLVALFLFILSLLDTTPLIGRWIAGIVDVVDRSK